VKAWPEYSVCWRLWEFESESGFVAVVVSIDVFVFVDVAEDVDTVFAVVVVLVAAVGLMRVDSVKGPLLLLRFAHVVAVVTADAAEKVVDCDGSHEECWDWDVVCGHEVLSAAVNVDISVAVAVADFERNVVCVVGDVADVVLAVD